ncbi:MAG: hypothetical protein H7269_15255 [Cellulomonas sp.]|nr:hypothetical protein [Cellulomonas sp.]
MSSPTQTMPVPRRRVLKAAGVRAPVPAVHVAVAPPVSADAHSAALGQAWSDGVAEGREQARGELAGAATAAAERGADALDRLAVLSSQQQATAISDASRAVLAAALDIAEWILRQELSRDSKALLHRLEDAAGRLLPATGLEVAVSPADEAMVRVWATRRNGTTVIPDAELAPGDARMRTEAGQADVTVAAALRVACELLGVDPARALEPSR